MERKRIKHAVAQADGYNIRCPYKACQMQIFREHINKGDILTCSNCRKPMRIMKVR